MEDWNGYDRRRSEVKIRASTPNPEASYCRVIDCGRPVRAATGDGLDMRYCRSHWDHYQRHGDAIYRTFAASVINPYRRAAYEWLKENTDDLHVENAIERVRGLYQRAGRREEAFRLRGKKPKERARIAWARLRDAEIEPLLLLAAWLAVEMLIKEDARAVTKREYKRVQAAKIVHRMASGTHKRWVRERQSPLWPTMTVEEIQELHWYPKSRGRLLRYIGEDIEGAAELVAAAHIETIQSFKRELDAEGKLPTRPHPASRVGVRRRYQPMG